MRHSQANYDKYEKDYDFWKYETLESLIERMKNGRDIEEAGDLLKRTKLHWAARWCQDLDIVSGLVHHYKADVNAEDIDSRIPLHLGAKYNTPDMVITLLKPWTNYKAKDRYGKTALDYAKDNPALKNTKAYQLLKDESQ